MLLQIWLGSFLVGLQHVGAKPMFSVANVQLNSSCCPPKSISCIPVKVYLSHISNNNILTVPFSLSGDEDEKFSVLFNQPQNCNGLCDIYNYKNPSGNILKVIKDGQGIYASLEGDFMTYSLLQCDDYYVWSDRPNIIDIPKSSKSNPENGNAASSVRVAPGPLCWYPNYHCSILHDLIKKIPAVGVTNEDQHIYCNQACKLRKDKSCTHFTWMKARGSSYCYLLSGCITVNEDMCISKGNCKSGPADCSSLSPNSNCTAPQLIPENSIQWQCVDPKSHKNIEVTKSLKNLPPGTVCIQRCSQWKTIFNKPAYLESTCQNDGSWSATRPNNGDPGLAVSSGPYPVPDTKFGLGGKLNPLSCSCPPLQPPPFTNGSNHTYFDPNDEPGAEFVCDTPLNFKRGDPILGDNTCRLFCDDFLTVNVHCVSGEWSGEPEKGIYCYKKPTVTPTGVSAYGYSSLDCSKCRCCYGCKCSWLG